MVRTNEACFDLFHWNCNSFYRKDSELNLIVSKYHPWIMSLNETRFKPSHSPKLKGYNIVTNSPLDPCGSGGVALLIRNCLSFNPLLINTNLQAAACRVNMAGTMITICSIYISPSININLQSLSQLVSLLPRPIVLVGDFNAHSPLWGSPSEDSRGKIVNELMTRSTLVCINDGSPTYIHPNGTQTHLDLVLCSPELSQKWKFSVLDDLHGSDHFPVTLSSSTFSPANSRRKRWNEKHANWNLYANQANLTNVSLDQPIEDIVDQYTLILSQAARSSMPMSSIQPLKRVVPWWSPEINTATIIRKQKLKHFNRNPTSENLIDFKRARSKTKRLIRLAKQSSWNEFRAQIGPTITSGELWGKIGALTGRRTRNEIPFIRDNNITFTDPLSVANALGASFSINSSSINYSAELLLHKDLIERNFRLSRGEGTNDLNNPFNLVELKAALKRGNSKAPGENLITNKMLNNLKWDSKIYLLKIFNTIWLKRTLPPQWKRAIIIPIPKNPKAISPSDFRPISLLNNDSKLMERMVNNRLIWFLEKNQLLSAEQVGFRTNRSCMDALQIITEAVSDVFLNSSHLSCIFFDIEKAYERVWRVRIIQQLEKWKVEGNILHFIWDYLSDRSFQVMIGNVRSAVFSQENGVTTGSSLAVTLFLVAIDSIKHVFIGSNVRFVLYADDLTVFYPNQNITHQKLEMSRIIGRLELWCKETGFSFASNKCKAMHFCRKYKCSPPNYTLNGIPIENVETHRFLGMTLDKKLNWKPHIVNTKNACKKSLNALKCLRGLHRGSNRDTLLQVFQSLVIPKLDYGCQFYEGAARSSLALLDPVLNEGLRIATGAFITSPTISVIAEAGVLNLSERRDLALLKFFIKQKARQDSPFHIHPSFSALSLRSKGEAISELYNIPTNILTTNPSVKHPFWKTNKLKISTDLHKLLKSSTPIPAFKAEFNQLLSSLPSHTYIQYTDGSKSNNGAGFAVTDMVSMSKKIRTPQEWSAMTLEAGALREAIRVASCHPSNCHSIFTDSLSTLEALKSNRVKNPIIREIKDMILDSVKSISLFWIPSHIGILGNEIADLDAKSAANKIEIDLPYTIGDDAAKLACAAIWREKANRWATMNPPNHLAEIKDKPIKWDSSNIKRRRDSTIICRLRIGHTNITHLHHILRTQAPMCDFCNCPLTVRHFLISCPRLSLQRTKFGIPNSLKLALADDIDILDRVLKYLGMINMYNQI